MARIPKPWFREDRQTYCVTIRGKRHDLGPDKTEADRLFHELMAKKPETPIPITTGLSVAEVFDKYLDWCEKHREPRTFEWYRDHIQSFMDTVKEPDKMPVPSLKPFHVIEWADQHPNWSNAYRRGAIVAIQRPFNWADELGYITGSPIKKINKPQPGRRENHVTPEDFADIIGHYSDGDPFRDLILFAWTSGCRPQEASQIEARHVNLEAGCIVIPKEEAKGKRRIRIIHLHGDALEIVSRLVAIRKGKLFLNEDGNSWNRFAINNRFDRLHLNHGIAKLKELGIQIEPLPRFNRRNYTDKARLVAARKEHQLKLRDRRKRIVKLARQHGVKFACYDLRHGFANRLLVNGIDHVTVAALMGHADGTQVARTYQHVDKQQDYLKKVLEANT